MKTSETFKHHELNEEQVYASGSIRYAAEDLEAVIVLRCVPSREKSLALTKLEECVMWANKAMAIHGMLDEADDGD